MCPFFPKWLSNFPPTSENLKISSPERITSKKYKIFPGLVIEQSSKCTLTTRKKVHWHFYNHPNIPSYMSTTRPEIPTLARSHKTFFTQSYSKLHFFLLSNARFPLGRLTSVSPSRDVYWGVGVNHQKHTLPIIPNPETYVLHYRASLSHASPKPLNHRSYSPVEAMSPPTPARRKEHDRYY